MTGVSRCKAGEEKWDLEQKKRKKTERVSAKGLCQLQLDQTKLDRLQRAQLRLSSPKTPQAFLTKEQKNDGALLRHIPASFESMTSKPATTSTATTFSEAAAPDPWFERSWLQVGKILRTSEPCA